MNRRITRMLYATVTAVITLSALGFAGAAAPATASARSPGPPAYTIGEGGYTSYGRWFRFVSITVTVAPRVTPPGTGGDMLIWLYHHTKHGDSAFATLGVKPNGGPGSVSWRGPRQQGAVAFKMSPKVGDKLTLSIYYDRHGKASFAAADLTQGITRTARVKTGKVAFNKVSLFGAFVGSPPSPPTDTRAWKVASTHLTTYTGVRGGVTGPWQTSKIIGTTDATAKGKVTVSPSGLWNHAQDFGVWVRHR